MFTYVHTKSHKQHDVSTKNNLENVKTTFTQSNVSQSMNNNPMLNMTSPATP